MAKAFIFESKHEIPFHKHSNPSFKKNFTKENLSLYHQQQLISSIYGTYMHHARMESSIYLLTKVTFYRNLERGVMIDHPRFFK